MKEKAIEHKIREAKVLGLNYDRKQFEQEYDSNLNKSSMDSSLTDEINNQDKNVIMINEQQVPAGIDPQFSYQIALQTASQIKQFNLSISEDTFGDDD